MAKRVGISTKTRFDIFKRDGFTCQYCNKGTSNGVVLEVDHIIPVCEGGNNSNENLITACFDCNRGKGGRELSQIPETLQEKTTRIAEKEKQYKAFIRLQKRIEGNMLSDIEAINTIYSDAFPKWEMDDRFKNSSVRNFIEHLGVFEVSKSMYTAIGKCSDNNHAIKYFCGVCWSKIKNGVDYSPFK